jgi:hypothetical protein
MSIGHTPAPWREEDGYIYGMEDGEEVMICQATEPGYALTEYDAANMPFIVKACNAYDDLVAALQALVDECDTNYTMGDDAGEAAAMERAHDLLTRLAGLPHHDGKPKQEPA